MEPATLKAPSKTSLADSPQPHFHSHFHFPRQQAAPEVPSGRKRILMAHMAKGRTAANTQLRPSLIRPLGLRPDLHDCPRLWRPLLPSDPRQSPDLKPVTLGASNTPARQSLTSHSLPGVQLTPPCCRPLFGQGDLTDHLLLDLTSIKSTETLNVFHNFRGFQALLIWTTGQKPWPQLNCHF